MKIKVGYIVSYDYFMLLTSVKQLYKDVDKIYVAIDSNLETWSGNKFHIPESFFDEVKNFDIDNKIEFYRAPFFVPELTAMECETRERNLLLKKMGKGWLIQLDVDEYVYDFVSLKKYLRKFWFLLIFPKITPIAFKGVLITLFKEVDGGFLYIKNNENFAFITNLPNYKYARTNPFIKRHLTNFMVIHQSWARDEDQIQLKIRNWGHRDDFDTTTYFDYWKKLSKNNYKEYKNFHPLVPKAWNKLLFLKAKNIDEFILKYADKHPQNLVSIPLTDMFLTLLKRIFKK